MQFYRVIKTFSFRAEETLTDYGLISVYGPHDITSDGTCRITITIMVHRGDDGILHAVDMAQGAIQRDCPCFFGCPTLALLSDGIGIGNVRLRQIYGSPCEFT